MSQIIGQKMSSVMFRLILSSLTAASVSALAIRGKSTKDVNLHACQARMEVTFSSSNGDISSCLR